MKDFSPILITFGILAIIIAFAILATTFKPVLSSEVNFLVSGPAKNDTFIPIDEQFGIVIPKIRANSKVIQDVDPYSEKAYQWALTKGVAHAKGTSLPGEVGNMFIFSHSSASFYEATKYNSIFYLLSKLEKEDEVFIYYLGQKFIYKVTDKVTVDPNNTSYLTRETDKRMLTLMTCWPPGTTFKRLIIIAELFPT